MSMSLGSPATVAEQNLSDQRRLQVNSGAGTRSLSTLSNTGEINIVADGRPDIGKKSEARVQDILLDCLRSVGHVATLIDGARDEYGEDGLVILDGDRMTIQITAVVPSDEFWHQSAKGGAAISGFASQGATWLHAAIMRKVGAIAQEQRRTTVLAIDARHLGVLVDPTVLIAYEKDYGSCARFGFRAAWVVGPVVAHSSRLP
jgi:hypothetical protein